jgi:hypothetical protein
VQPGSQRDEAGRLGEIGKRPNVQAELFRQAEHRHIAARNVSNVGNRRTSGVGMWMEMSYASCGLQVDTSTSGVTFALHVIARFQDQNTSMKNMHHSSPSNLIMNTTLRFLPVVYRFTELPTPRKGKQKKKEKDRKRILMACNMQTLTTMSIRSDMVRNGIISNIRGISQACKS